MRAPTASWCGARLTGLAHGLGARCSRYADDLVLSGDGRLRAPGVRALVAEIANRAGHPAFPDHVRGRIAWLESLQPDRGARLRERFARITW